MSDSDPGKEAQSWLDEFTISMLSDVKQHQAAILDLPDYALSSALEFLDHTSEEFIAGATILQNRAAGSTSLILVEASNEIDNEVSNSSSHTGAANNEAYNESLDQYTDAWARIDYANNEAKNQATSGFEIAMSYLAGVPLEYEQGIITTTGTSLPKVSSWLPELILSSLEGLVTFAIEHAVKSLDDFLFEEE